MSVRVQGCVWNPAPWWTPGLVGQGPRRSKIGRLEPRGSEEDTSGGIYARGYEMWARRLCFLPVPTKAIHLR